MIAALLLLFAAQAPAAKSAEPAPYTGKFMVGYQPIYCRQAPCPPGHYKIMIPGQSAVSVSKIVYDPDTPPALRLSAQGRGTWPDGLAIDGKVSFVRSADGRITTATILARHAIAGLWKP